MAGLFNRRRAPKFRTLTHLNWMGATTQSEVSDPLLRLRLATSMCQFGEPEYYPRKGNVTPDERDDPRWWLTDRAVSYLRDMLGAVDPPEWRYLTPAQLLERAIDDALNADVAATLGEAARLRQESGVRLTPQVILVRAANHPQGRGSGLIREYATEIVDSAEEPALGLAYQLARYGKPVPNSLKKAWRDALESFDNLDLGRHRLENHPVKTRDVVNLVHAQSAAINQLMHGQLRSTSLTWEAILSERGSNRAAWLDAVQVMGHTDLLRNLRNLLEAGVEPNRFVERLVESAANDGLPTFRYYSAFRAVEKARLPRGVSEEYVPLVLEGIQEALTEAQKVQPRFAGRVMALADNSGSARRPMPSSMGRLPASTIGNVSAVSIAGQADVGMVSVFGDRLRTFRVRKGASLFDQVVRAEKRGRRVGGRTEHGIWLFWHEAIKQQQRWDAVFVFSDMQAGHGSLYGLRARHYPDYVWAKVGGNAHINVPRLIATYREQVNPSVMVYLVQVSGYQETIVPEFYERTYLLGGWGEGLLDFAAEMASLYRVPVTT